MISSDKMIEEKTEKAAKKLVTFNLQGATGFATNSERLLDYDYICLQEVGKPPESWGVTAEMLATPDTLHTGKFERKHGRGNIEIYFAYYQWSGEMGGTRSSLYIASRTHAGTKLNAKQIEDPNAAIARPMVGIEVLLNCWVFTIHSQSMGTGNTHGAMIRNHLDALQNLGNLTGKWVVAGDLNQDEGKDIASSGKYQAICGRDATQLRGKTLDYAIISSNPPRPEVIYKNSAQVFSDHIGQEFAVIWGD